MPTPGIDSWVKVLGVATFGVQDRSVNMAKMWMVKGNGGKLGVGVGQVWGLVLFLKHDCCVTLV